jgi:hypothetical protein
MRTLTGIPRVILVAWVAGMLAGCVGPKAMQSTRTQYNVAIQDTSNEQLLLNLVRLRYRENMTFLDVKQINAAYGLKLSATPGWETAGKRILSVTGEYTETPSITYDPVQSEQFAKRVISAIDSNTMLTMIGSGWHIDEFLRLTVDQIGDFQNDPRTLRSADDTDCSFRQFRKICSSLRTLQNLGALDMSVETDGALDIHILKSDATYLDSLLKAESGGFYFVKKESTDKEYVMRKDGTPVLTMTFRHYPKDPDREKAVQEIVTSLFGTLRDVKDAQPPSGWELRLATPSSESSAPKSGETANATSDDKFPIKLRSFETIMYLLSQGIPVPQSDARYVKPHYYSRKPHTPDNEIPWAKAVGLINVKHSSTPPSNPYVAVRYHNAWFYIDQAEFEVIGKAAVESEEDKVESKDTLTMLNYIYSLQTGDVKAAAPLLTIPTK